MLIKWFLKKIRLCFNHLRSIYAMLEVSISSFSIIKLFFFRFVLIAFLIIFNYYTFTYILDIKNNVHVFIMIAMCISIHYVAMFFYMENKLFRYTKRNKKSFLILEKFKRKLKKDTSLENIIIRVIMCVLCVVFRKFIKIYVLDFDSLFNLCLLSLIILIFSVISKYFLLKLIRYVKRYL